MSRVSDHAKRSGFTLLELLIALSLVTTLMALGWSLFSTFARLESRARRTVSGLEIKRTFQRQLQDDLDQIVFFGPDLFKSLPPQAGVNELKLLLSENGSSFEIPLGGLPGFTSSESENPSGVSGSAPESHGGLDYLRQVFF